MLNNPEISSSPYFYLLIAASLLLSLGYMWGRRRNTKIFRSAFNGLIAVLKPKDQQFTNIGGLSGYHANIVPRNSKFIRRVDATITLLPRQSWLWYPFSLIIRKFDRLYAVFFLSAKACGAIEEGHLIEDRYSGFGGAKIENADQLTKETIEWSGKTFHLYYQSEQVKTELQRCIQILGEAGPVRHVALVPEQERMWLFMIPRVGSVEGIVQKLTRWLSDCIGRRMTSSESANG